MLALTLGSFAGFALGKLRFRGRITSLSLIPSMSMFPQIVILTSSYGSFARSTRRPSGA